MLWVTDEEINMKRLGILTADVMERVRELEATLLGDDRDYFICPFCVLTGIPDESCVHSTEDSCAFNDSDECCQHCKDTLEQ